MWISRFEGEAALCFRSMAVLGHSNAQRAIALSFSNDLRSVTMLRPRTGALRRNYFRAEATFQTAQPFIRYFFPTSSAVLIAVLVTDESATKIRKLFRL